MKYIKYYNYIFIISLIFLVGCKEDLDLKPIAASTELTYYKDSTAVDKTVTAAYGELCAREVFDKDYYLAVGSIPCDDVEAGGESINDWPVVQHYDEFNYNKIDVGPLDDIWNYCYKGCRLANTALEKMLYVKQNFPKNISDYYITLRSGEMKFLRALYHFMLVQTFGGVPIADKVVQTDDFTKPRNSISEVLDFCENDLKEAVNDLPVINSAPGRATKGAAQSLLAKVYLYESSYAKNYTGDDRFTGCTEHWQDALDNAEAVINSGIYKLIGANGEHYPSWRNYPNTTDTITNGFRWLFTVSGDNSQEGIFEIQNVSDHLGWSYTRGNCLSVYQTCRKYTKSDGTLGDIGGWSFNCPTDYLVQAFRNADPRETNLHSAQGADGTEIDDPRFSTTVGRDGDTIQIFVEKQGLQWAPMNFSNLPTGMIGRKFECSYDEYWKFNDWTQCPFNVRLIRYAEVILFAAEAAIMLNDNAKALYYVNMVRTRARNCGTTGKPENLTSVSLEDVIHERRLELACEPARFFDLVRWNLTDKFINGIQNKGMGSTTEFVKEKHEFFPLPDDQVQLSKGGLVQYPGWQ